MSGASRFARVAERFSLLLGLSLLSFFVLAYLHRLVMLQMEMRRLDKMTRPAAVAAIPNEKTIVGPQSTGAIDTAFWSIQRVKQYQANLSASVEPLALLRISRLNLEAPVLDGTDAFTLNRGVGRIRSTALPGQDGNIGIAGHRDGFFRPLKEIKKGDTIELVTISGTSVYVVDRIRVTGPADLSVLRPREKPSLTLVTCYPFYFIGPAPNRFVVEASLQDVAREGNAETENTVR